MNTSSPSVGTTSYRLATRIAFFVTGFLMASWAPLITYAKTRLELNEATLGLLLLCVGIGSLVCMPMAGSLAQRLGLRRMIIGSSLVFCSILPGLAICSNVAAMAVLLLIFGASLGLMDICINFQAAAVERAAKMPLMSGFHGFFSIGTFAGVSSGTALLTAGITPITVTLSAAALCGLLTLLFSPRLIPTMSDSGSDFFARPRGIVSLLALLTFICLLQEGAMLDWGALLLGELQNVPPAVGGIGYSVFTLAMSIGRLSGDWASARFGDRRLLQYGVLLAIAGFAMVLVLSLNFALVGFMMIGLGLANLIPILFRAALNQDDVPSAQALSAVATLGYLGILLGPALIGFASHASSLKTAFIGLAALLGVVLLSATVATRSNQSLNQDA
ncbi:MFS transporter [Pseudomonas alliivorans]|nr:MFS transporter [Pseudomonas alliivorans]